MQLAVIIIFDHGNVVFDMLPGTLQHYSPRLTGSGTCMRYIPCIHGRVPAATFVYLRVSQLDTCR